MALIDLFRNVPGSSAHVAAAIPLAQRLRAALAKPPQPNRYAVPRLRTIDAVAFALRGYKVEWTEPRMLGDHVVSYSTLVSVGSFSKWELPTIVPAEVTVMACAAKTARHAGWRVGLDQLRRELSFQLARRWGSR